MLYGALKTQLSIIKVLLRGGFGVYWEVKQQPQIPCPSSFFNGE